MSGYISFDYNFIKMQNTYNMKCLLIALITISSLTLKAQTICFTVNDLTLIMEASNLETITKKNLLELNNGQTLTPIILTNYDCEEDTEVVESYVEATNKVQFLKGRKHLYYPFINFDQEIAKNTKLKHVKSGVIVITSKKYGAPYNGQTLTREGDFSTLLVLDKGDKFIIVN